LKTVLRIVAASVILIGAVAIHGRRADAQAMVGRDIGTNRVSVDYYKAPPGRQDEWLALYKKYHRPIMDFQIQNAVRHQIALARHAVGFRHHQHLSPGR